jgi:hypothetical protein
VFTASAAAQTRLGLLLLAGHMAGGLLRVLGGKRALPAVYVTLKAHLNTSPLTKLVVAVVADGVHLAHRALEIRLKQLEVFLLGALAANALL